MASCYGMHLSVVANDVVEVEGVAEALLKDNAKIHSLSRYHLGPETHKGLVMGYGSAAIPELKRGLTLLRSALTGKGRAVSRASFPRVR